MNYSGKVTSLWGTQVYRQMFPFVKLLQLPFQDHCYELNLTEAEGS